MDTDFKKRQPRSFRDLDMETRARELTSLQDELHKTVPITYTRLSEWAEKSTDRAALLRGAVFCGIHWKRSLGKPSAPSITDGFIITHMFHEFKPVAAGGGQYPDKGKDRTMPAPSVWDATKTPDEYRVGILLFAAGGPFDDNRLIVKLAPVHWERTELILPGYRRLDPFAYGPFSYMGEWIVIPDYEVISVPYAMEKYIQALGSEEQP